MPIISFREGGCKLIMAQALGSLFSGRAMQELGLPINTDKPPNAFLFLETAMRLEGEIQKKLGPEEGNDLHQWVHHLINHHPQELAGLISGTRVATFDEESKVWGFTDGGPVLQALLERYFEFLVETETTEVKLDLEQTLPPGYKAAIRLPDGQIVALN